MLMHFLIFCFGDIYAMQKEKCSEEISGIKTCIRLKHQNIKLNKGFEFLKIFQKIQYEYIGLRQNFLEVFKVISIY